MASKQKRDASLPPTPSRSISDYNYELKNLDAAHAQNEAGRDAFLGLAHTALFAASISFVGDVTPLGKAILKPVLVFAWALSVIGLVSLTISFQAARQAIDRRREALNDPIPPDSKSAEYLNAVALWTFPIAVLCIFAFVSANLIHMSNDPPRPTTAPVVIKKGVTPPPRAPSHDGSPTPSTGVIPSPRAPAPTPPPPAPKK